MSQTPSESIPVVHVSRDAIEVDGARYPLDDVEDVQLREHTDWAAIVIGILAAHGILVLGFVLRAVDAPAIAEWAAYAVAGILLTASWFGAAKRQRFYELVVQRGSEKQIIAHSHAPEPVYRAWDELRQLGVVV